MKKLTSFLPACLILALSLVSIAQANPDFNGRWKIDPAQSTSLDPWSNLELEIAVNGDKVTLTRYFSTGTRQAEETLELDTNAGSQTVAVEGWWDNRHIDAWLGNDGRIEVNPRWLDEGRTLQLNINLVLETQQGDAPVRVLRELRLSADGKSLRELQIRSSRKLPIVQIFHKL